MLELYLCGVLHADPRGPKRLQKVLDLIKPDVITAETTLEQLEIAKKNYKIANSLSKPLYMEYVKTIIAQKGIKANLKTYANYLKVDGFEDWASYLYATKNGILFMPIDDEDLREQSLMAKVEDGRFRQGATTMFSKDLATTQKENDQKYNIDSDDRFEEGYCREDTLRDEHMARKILKYSGRVLHIGGIAHIFGKQRNLGQILASHNPTKIRLIEADKFDFNPVRS